MNEMMLTLKPGVILTEQDCKVGLALNGLVQFAKDVQQAEILRALIERPQPIESLMALLRELDHTQNNNKIPLHLAGFILDFGEYLET